jgi:uncharacterized circularly permuted ATP-grasp superfamily protein
MGTRARAFMNRGVTFAYDGQERPFPVDIAPRHLKVVHLLG